MMPTHPDSTPIFASDGVTIHRLHLVARANDSPMLLDDAGIPVAPWEAELLCWPPEVELALRRGGYLPLQPTDMELWCNCAD